MDILWVAQDGRIELEFRSEDVSYVCRSGANDEYVHDVVHLPRVAAQLAKLTPGLVRAELVEYGAWDEDELADHMQNLHRLVWIALWDCKEDNDSRAATR